MRQIQYHISSMYSCIGLYQCVLRVVTLEMTAQTVFSLWARL